MRSSSWLQVEVVTIGEAVAHVVLMDVLVLDVEVGVQVGVVDVVDVEGDRERSFVNHLFAVLVASPLL